MRDRKGIPVYESIKQQLKQQIETGLLKEGQRVPSELELARELGVSRGQTRLALRDLEMAGYLLRSAGRGSFVAPVSNRARQLGMKGFRMVAMACADFYSVYRRKVIESFGQYVLDAGFRTLTYFLGLRDEKELDFIEESRNSGIEGLALWLQQRTGEARAVLSTFREGPFPCVLCDRYLRGFEVDSVATDNVDVGYRLTQALIQQGHRHIAFATLWFDMTPTEDRLEGYRKALTEAGLSVDDGLVGSFDTPGESPTSVVKGILACRHRPTAMLCADDRVLKTVVNVLVQMGYRLPEDMSFASVDDDDTRRNFDLPVVWASQNAEEIGRQTGELLITRIQEPRKDVEKRFVKACFVDSEKANDSAPEETDWRGGDSGLVRQKVTSS